MDHQYDPISASASAPPSTSESPEKPASIVPTTSQPDIDVEEPDLKQTRLEFALDWTVKILALIVAIFFGVWAPLSYKAAADGNNSNDASQSSLMAQVNQLSSAQTSAAYVQSRAAQTQSVMLASIESRIGAMGQLALLDFCISRTVSDRFSTIHSPRSSCRVTGTAILIMQYITRPIRLVHHTSMKLNSRAW